MPKPSVLIVGGGLFGTSTAYHLSLHGYHNVKVLDRFAPPSEDSAATDLNKTIRYDYPDPLYAKLAMEAMEIWKSADSPVSGLFRQTGWVMAGTHLAKDWVVAASNVTTRIEESQAKFMSAAEIREMWPAFTGPFKDWTSFWSPQAGWVPSDEALLLLARSAQSRGVKYITGSQGHVIDLLFNREGACVAVKTADGIMHEAEEIILAAGAFTGTLIGVDGELVAKSMCIACIQLTPEEQKLYSNLPMLDHFEHGMLFPPNKDGIMKLCSCRYVTNFVGGSSSVGRSSIDYPDDGIPDKIDQELRGFLKDVLPEISQRPWQFTRMCWDASTNDENFRICPHPEHKHLYLATGGTFHGFKFLPTIGEYVVQMIEGKLSPQLRVLWRWRFGQDCPVNNVGRHPIPSRDIQDLSEDLTSRMVASL